MSLYVIGDLHLCFSDPSKTMAVFAGWDNYQERIEKNWRETVKPEDTVVLAGDISWGMSLQQAEPDFRFINGLPGRKIILKGNHDYWWVTMKKMEGFFAENGFDTLNILHNNHYEYEGIGICGTRGWVNDNYGHIHGRSAHALCVTNTYDDIDFHLIAGDYIQFMPEKVM